MTERQQLLGWLLIELKAHWIGLVLELGNEQIGAYWDIHPECVAKVPIKAHRILAKAAFAERRPKFHPKFQLIYGAVK